MAVVVGELVQVVLVRPSAREVGIAEGCGPDAARRRPGPHPPGGEILLNFELDVLVGEALGHSSSPRDEHGLLAARVHESCMFPRVELVASRVHEVLGDRDEPQVDVGGEHALASCSILAMTCPVGLMIRVNP